MVWRCEFTSLKYLSVLPTGRRLVVAVIGLKSAAEANIKNIGSILCNAPARIWTIILKIQVKLLCLAFDCFLRVLRIVKYKTELPSLSCEADIGDQGPDVSSEAVVKRIKKVRTSFLLALKKRCSLDIKSDVDGVRKRMEEVRKCVDESDENVTRETMARLKELDEPFEDLSWKQGDMEVRELTDDEESETEDDRCEDLLQMSSSDKTIVSSNQSNVQDLFEREVENKQLNEIPSNRPVRNISQENDVFQNQLSMNRKLDDVFIASSNLVGELKKLTTQISQLTLVSEKMAKMEQELSAGRKLLQEVESDRNVMKMKLSVLEDMIAEEEQYLDDVSGESGYDECESLSLKSS